jgi:hypothetical protein
VRWQSLNLHRPSSTKVFGPQTDRCRRTQAVRRRFIHSLLHFACCEKYEATGCCVEMLLRHLLTSLKDGMNLNRALQKGRVTQKKAEKNHKAKKPFGKEFTKASL